jgi:hypothetical protein
MLTADDDPLGAEQMADVVQGLCHTWEGPEIGPDVNEAGQISWNLTRERAAGVGLSVDQSEPALLG